MPHGAEDAARRPGQRGYLVRRVGTPKTEAPTGSRTAGFPPAAGDSGDR
ncbi:MAG: hypothetical protein AVDCRST_MAG49-4462 [uncultured Thermomicrobiales bacterium]|uniref:Uncharacterized protein n=1 Tax=uncultured Thermomicrobiales bacterium TaxID=1645740 RepID=A0A6J4VK36_9BACT|nr:MAG: hypothetical protein AVDCRST_MAG49-4462 [uncultured Thermomicrobiales bacterium]